MSDVSLDVHVGEVHAVIGPNGAGKSTLINLLSGDLPVTCGRDHARRTRHHRHWRRRDARIAGVGRSYQKTTIFQTSTVFENVRLAAQAHGGSHCACSACATRRQRSTAAREAALRGNRPDASGTHDRETR